MILESFNSTMYYDPQPYGVDFFWDWSLLAFLGVIIAAYGFRRFYILQSGSQQ